MCKATSELVVREYIDALMATLPKRLQEACPIGKELGKAKSWFTGIGVAMGVVAAFIGWLVAVATAGCASTSSEYTEYDQATGKPVRTVERRADVFHMDAPTVMRGMEETKVTEQGAVMGGYRQLTIVQQLTRWFWKWIWVIVGVLVLYFVLEAAGLVWPPAHWVSGAMLAIWTLGLSTLSKVTDRWREKRQNGATHG